MSARRQSAVAPPARRAVSPAFEAAIAAWADATTDANSPRRRDLLRDKQTAVTAFFAAVDAPPACVQPADVKRWQQALEARGLAASTVYALLSRVSSFYGWARRDPALGTRLGQNPVALARPRAPKPFQSESTKALADLEVTRLLAVVRAHAQAGNLSARRDYALLVLLFLTGLRRSEVVRLKWGDVELASDALVLRMIRVKGGTYRARRVRHASARAALLAYLDASGRLDAMTELSPLWIRHDRACDAERPLSAHGLALNVKRYATETGVTHMHLHRTRHTFARMVSEDFGSLLEVQEALGHRSAAVTRAYVQRISVKEDRYSDMLATRLGL